MIKLRKFISWIILVVILLIAIAETLSETIGFGPIFLPANYVILFFLISLSATINPTRSNRTKRLAVLGVIALPVGFLAGIATEIHQAEVFISSFSKSGGVSYFYSEESGVWIEDKSFLDSAQRALDDGSFKIDWKESLGHWIHGGQACICGRGEPIKYRDSGKRMFLKHGKIQSYGFVSLDHPALIDLQVELGNQLSKIQKRS